MPKTLRTDVLFEIQEFSTKIPVEFGADRQREIEAVVNYAVRHEIQDVVAAVKDLDPADGWPRIGEWCQAFQQAAEERLKAREKPKSGSDITDFRNIGGYRFDEIMSTKEGRRAMAKGRPHSFLKQVISREIPVESLTFPDK